MNDTDQTVSAAVARIREHTDAAPEIGLILGSGLGDFADSLPGRVSIPTSDLPHYPVSTVQGHKGHLVFAKQGSRSIVVFQGRVHFYECGDLERVLFPVRVAAALGVRTMILTNAAGGIGRHLLPGDLMAITDQINLTGESIILASKKQLRYSPVYTSGLLSLVEFVGKEKGIVTKRGVYCGVKGPSYETASEVEMIHRIGGDAVGMSTVFEASLASSLGMSVVGISCITNLATGISPTRLDHSEVTETANRVKTQFRLLVSRLIDALPS